MRSGRGVVDDFHRLPPARASRHRLDRIDDGVIAGAAAVVAGDLLADFLAARHAAAAQQFLRGQQHAGRTEAALQRVALLEGLLQVGDLAGVRHAFDGLDRGAVALRRQHQAAAHDHAVDPHRAGAADAVLAADMAAGQHEIVAQEIDQGLARIDRLGDGLAVHRQRDVAAMLAHGRASMSCFATRRSSTPARCFLVAPVACTSSDGSRSEASACTASSMLPSVSAGLGLLRAQRRHRRRRNRRAARRPGLAVGLRAGGEPDHGVVAVAAGEFGKADARVLASRPECGSRSARRAGRARSRTGP